MFRSCMKRRKANFCVAKGAVGKFEHVMRMIEKLKFDIMEAHIGAS